VTKRQVVAIQFSVLALNKIKGKRDQAIGLSFLLLELESMFVFGLIRFLTIAPSWGRGRPVRIGCRFRHYSIYRTHPTRPLLCLLGKDPIIVITVPFSLELLLSIPDIYE
jgi:hypothetical protein